MIGTAPIFYKIRVTKGLADAVTYGFFPPLPTVVHFHVPAVPRPHHRLREGMKPLDNRHIILRCYEAFKRFIIVSLPILSLQNEKSLSLQNKLERSPQLTSATLHEDAI